MDWFLYDIGLRRERVNMGEGGALTLIRGYLLLESNFTFKSALIENEWGVYQFFVKTIFYDKVDFLF